MQSSCGVTVTDVDGNVFYDLAGSYGVNIFGNDFYKDCIAAAEKRAHALGPVLGPYHPVITDNVRRLCEISGLDEVSFHMSGTEAVMGALRAASVPCLAVRAVVRSVRLQPDHASSPASAGTRGRSA